MKLDELIEQLKKENATLKAELARAIELKDGETYDWDLLGRVQERDAWRTEAIAARELLSMSMEQIYSNHDGDIYCSVCHKAWPIHTEKCTYHSVKNAYLSARVKDGE